MSSLKVSPFTNLGTPNNVLSDDYVHGTFETYKLKAATTNGGKLDYKIKVNASKSGDKISTNVVDEGKIQFPVFDRYTVQLCQRRKGDLKAHLDFGSVVFGGKTWSPFTNVKTDTTLNKFQYRLGANYFGSALESSCRLELTPGEAPVFSHRSYVKKAAHYYGTVLSLNLSSLALARYDALVGYTQSKYEVNLKHESDSKSKSVEVGTLIGTATYFHDDNTKAAVEVKNKGTECKPGVTVGVQRKVNKDLTVKGKFDNKLNLALSAKYAINKQFTLTTGCLLDFGGKCCDHNKFPPLPLGLQLDINV